MELKNSKIFNSQTMQAVSAFCESQEIKNIDNFIYLCFKQGFDIKRYGLLGKTLNEGEKHLKTDEIQEKQVEIEVIKEIRVEVPVEVIKEVEKIVEVTVEKIVEVIKEVPVDRVVEKEIIREIPVEKIVIQEVIKEVPVDRVVEKIILTSDDTQINELLLKIQELENEMSKKNNELDELLSKIEQLNGKISTKTTEIDNIRQEFSTKTIEMENIFQNEMSKKYVELDELRRKLDDPVTNNKLNMLQDTLQNLRNDLQQKNEQIRELEKINRDLLNGNQNQAYLMRGSNLNRRI
jgi:chromosome segregation ATPase